MISNCAQPIYIYPDQLITETWPQWVESVLSKTPSPEFRNNRGFQQIIGSDDSYARTRASESYRMGLLLHRIINERTVGNNGLPVGWDYLCNGKPVLSKIGFLAYAIGKALSNNPENIQFAKALNILCLLFSLSLGTERDGVAVSTLLVFARVIQCAKQEIGEKEFFTRADDYHRWLAGAVFNTLDHHECRENLLKEYADAVQITSLILEQESDHTVYPVTASMLKRKFQGDNISIPEINKITRHKAALFWASPDRGIYSRALRADAELIDTIVKLDRSKMQSDRTSVLEGVLKISVGEEYLLLEKLNEVMLSNGQTSIQWGNLMKTLAQGVYSALAYLEQSSSQISGPRIFHLHGAEAVPESEVNIEVTVNKLGLPLLPGADSVVMVVGRAFRIIDIIDSGETYVVKLEALINQV